MKNKTDNIEEHFVDLGLPSGLKWAKCNLGAKTETNYGNYYMWGSTTPNTADECTWTNASFNNGSSLYNEEHFTTHKSEWLDDKNNLRPEYDVAYKATNGMGRMPTRGEIQELLSGTTNEWIHDYKGTGVNGRKFTGSNGNSIFIPAAGWCCNGSVNYVGIYGDVWSSSLDTSYNYNAWYLGCSSDSCFIYNSSRYCGWPIRTVTDKKKKKKKRKINGDKGEHNIQYGLY